MKKFLVLTIMLMIAFSFTSTNVKAVTEYTVTFNSMGGSLVDSQLVEENLTATEPTDPTYIGKTFGGWYTNGGFTTLYDFATPVTASITLYAKWSTTQFYVTFNLNGGTPSIDGQVINYNGLVTEPSDPTKSNYTFGGWYLADLVTEFDFSTLVTQNYNLYAKWIPVQYTVHLIAWEVVQYHHKM